MRTAPPELTDEVRAEAIAYVDAVVEAAAGGGRTRAVAQERELERKPFVTRLVPDPLKRALVRFLIYVMRHPFDHLAHPLQIRLEEEIGQARSIAQAALARADRSDAEVRRLKAELERERRGR